MIMNVVVAFLMIADQKIVVDMVVKLYVDVYVNMDDDDNDVLIRS